MSLPVALALIPAAVGWGFGIDAIYLQDLARYGALVRPDSTGSHVHEHHAP